MVKGDNEKAEELINSIKYPNLLSKQQKAYFYFAKAVFEQDINHLDEAEALYLNSLKLGLRTTNDTAIINLNLAQIYYRKGLLEAAKTRLNMASELSHKGTVDVDIQKLKRQIEV